MNSFLLYLNFPLSLLGAWFVYRTVCLFLELKKAFLCRLLVYFSCFLLLCMVIYIGDWANLPPTLLFFLFCLWISSRESSPKKIYTALLLSCVYFSFSALKDNYLYSYPPFGKYLFALVFYLLLRRQPPPRNFRLSPALWKLLFLLTLTPVGILLSVVLLDTSAYTPYQVYLLDFVLLLLSLFSFSGLLWTSSILARQQELEAEHAVFQASRTYYESLEQQHLSLRRLKHDMANHLQTLLHLPDQEKDPYIENLLQTPALLQTVKYCQDNTVNIILSSKAAAFSQHQIPFHVQVRIPQTLPFESPDLCTILCNALDNALEACLKLPEEQRQVTLRATYRKEIFSLEVTNPLPCQLSSLDTGKPDKDSRGLGLNTSKPTKDNHGLNLNTSKPDKDNHGLGLRNIRAAAEKNSGGMEITAKDGTFSLFVYLCHAHR